MSLRTMADNIILVGLIGLLFGVALRTLAPFVQKWLEKKLVWKDFLNRFIGIAAGAYVASAIFYLDLAPISGDPIRELLWTLLLGVAGNEIFNRIYHYYDKLIAPSK